MNSDGKHNDDRRRRTLEKVSEAVRERNEVPVDGTHVVFDFTGLERPDISDLALILTARLQAPLHESVWVRALDPRTSMVLRVLGLSHLFRSYPEADVLN